MVIHFRIRITKHVTGGFGKTFQNLSYFDQSVAYVLLHLTVLLTRSTYILTMLPVTGTGIILILILIILIPIRAALLNNTGTTSIHSYTTP